VGPEADPYGLEADPRALLSEKRIRPALLSEKRIREVNVRQQNLQKLPDLAEGETRIRGRLEADPER
jgi:hypothetical protein